MACVYRAAAVIATDKEDLVERVKEITGMHCSVCRGKNLTASSTMPPEHLNCARIHLLAGEYKIFYCTGPLLETTCPHIAHGVMVGLSQ